MENQNVVKSDNMRVTTNLNVYFDDFTITHTKSKVLQEDHYYPFGMNIQALSSNAPLSKPNQFKYNGGTELNNDFSLDWLKHYLEVMMQL